MVTLPLAEERQAAVEQSESAARATMGPEGVYLPNEVGVIHLST